MKSCRITSHHIASHRIASYNHSMAHRDGSSPSSSDRGVGDSRYGKEEGQGEGARVSVEGGRRRRCKRLQARSVETLFMYPLDLAVS